MEFGAVGTPEPCGPGPPARKSGCLASPKAARRRVATPLGLTSSPRSLLAPVLLLRLVPRLGFHRHTGHQVPGEHLLADHNGGRSRSCGATRAAECDGWWFGSRGLHERLTAIGHGSADELRRECFGPAPVSRGRDRGVVGADCAVDGVVAPLDRLPGVSERVRDRGLALGVLAGCAGRAGAGCAT